MVGLQLRVLESQLHLRHPRVVSVKSSRQHQPERVNDAASIWGGATVTLMFFQDGSSISGINYTRRGPAPMPRDDMSRDEVTDEI
jgi:hypothetical protein